VRVTYGVIFSLFTAVVAALFFWQLFTLFNSSSAPVLERKPYTRENVLAALSKIDLFFWLWIGGIVVGLVLFEVFPVEKKQRKISPDLQYKRLKPRLPKTEPEGMACEYQRVKDTDRIILASKCAAWVLFFAACIYGIVYLCIPSHFNNKNVTLEVLDLIKAVFPCIFAGLITICCAAIYEKYAVNSILPDVKKLTAGRKAEQSASVITKAEAVLSDKWVLLGVRIALAALAVAFIIWGSLNGNMRDILIKAINICTECIGLG